MIGMMGIQLVLTREDGRECGCEQVASIPRWRGEGSRDTGLKALVLSFGDSRVAGPVVQPSATVRRRGGEEGGRTRGR